MRKQQAKPNSKEQQSEIDAALATASPIVRTAVAEFRKEIDRLQHVLVKERIAHESAMAALRAEREAAITLSAPLRDQLKREYVEGSKKIKALRAGLQKDA